MRKIGLFALMSISLLLISGCTNNNENTSVENSSDSVPESSKLQYDIPELSEQESVELDSVYNPSNEETTEEIEEQIEEISVLEGLPEFILSSGAGAWGTILEVDADGNFKGGFDDSNMGDIGERNPNGVHYYSEFSGKFTEPEQINSYTYSMRIQSMELSDIPGTEYVEDGILFIYSEPYGLDGAEELLLYLPGAPIEELPEEFLYWCNIHEGMPDMPEELPFYGLYNVKRGFGFVGRLEE